SFPQMVMVYKAKESTVDPTKIQIQLQPTEMTPSEQSGTAPTEQQEQKSEDEASKSLEDQFKTAPPSPPETKKYKAAADKRSAAGFSASYLATMSTLASAQADSSIDW